MRKIVPIYEYKCDDCGKITELLESAAIRVSENVPTAAAGS